MGEIFFFLTSPVTRLVEHNNLEAQKNHYGFNTGNQFKSQRDSITHAGYKWDDFLREGLFTSAANGGKAMAAFLGVFDDYRSSLDFNGGQCWNHKTNPRYQKATRTKDPYDWKKGLREYDAWGKYYYTLHVNDPFGA